jgi:hypothetical protein
MTGKNNMEQIVIQVNDKEKAQLLYKLLSVLDFVNTIKKVESNEKPKDLGWSPGFFERTAGAWEGEPLKREEQGEYEQREVLL